MRLTTMFTSSSVSHRFIVLKAHEVGERPVCLSSQAFQEKKFPVDMCGKPDRGIHRCDNSPFYQLSIFVRKRMEHLYRLPGVVKAKNSRLWEHQCLAAT